MAVILPVQHGFHAGELTPLVEMRYDLEVRKFGVRTLENWFIHLQGPIETAKGYEFITDMPGTYGRIFPFYISIFSGFIVTVTPDTVFVNDQNGFVEADNMVPNGDFLDGGTNWGTIESGPARVIFSGGACSLRPGGSANRPAGIFQELTVLEDEPYRFVIQIASGVGQMEVQIGSTEGGADILPVTVYLGDETVTLPEVATTGTIMWLQIVAPGGEPNKALSKIVGHNTSTPSSIISFPSPWTTTSEIATMQTKMAPGTLDLYMTSSHNLMQILSYDKGTRVWNLGEAVFVSPPGKWVNNSYPAAIEFFEGRLYLGGAPNDPEYFWASKPKDQATGSYLDFTTGTLPDDAIAYFIERKGQIMWISGSKNLVMGTENAEFIIDSKEGLIIPGDIQSTLQSTHGSMQMQSIEVGNEILFVSPDGRKLRSMGYEWTKEAWATKDITFGSEHITFDNRLSSIHYAANPYSTIIGRTSTYQMLGCAFSPQAQVGGWFRRTTQGRIISTCVLSYAGVDEIWVLVDRDEDGDQLSLERVDGRDNNIKVDSYQHFVLEPENATDTFVAPHLGGMDCQVLANGAVHRNLTPEPDGTFVLDYPAHDVIIGLQIISTMVTLPRDDGLSIGGFQKGSALKAKKRWVKLYARIQDSWKPKINGRRPPERRGQATMNEIQPASTENVKVANTGWDESPVITIEQDLPLKTLLIGIYGELDQN